MKLKQIDKKRYRSHLRMVFIGMALALMVISLPSSTLLIHLFSTPEVSHFYYNIAGVAFAAVIVFVVLNKFRQHSFMLEVVYVWDLKQQFNRITRKLRKIEAAVESNNNDAMIIMNFMYRGSKQLYVLDDNTITMDSLNRKISVLDQRMGKLGLCLSTNAYDPAMLNQF
ncbi:MAG: hypothetical protein COB38_07065 [Gammaproteobacteria bacterium]|nr:MAG: hypothetical protein COB38_07065 [Gammaproteobacteria bacterium]